MSNAQTQKLPQLLHKLQTLTNTSKHRNSQQLFCIGYLFSKFTLKSSEEFVFLFQTLSLLSIYTEEKIVYPNQKAWILDQIVSSNKPLVLGKPFQDQFEKLISSCITANEQKMGGTVSRMAQSNISMQNTRGYETKSKLSLEQIKQQEQMSEQAARKLQEEYNRQSLMRNIETIKQTNTGLSCPICLQDIDVTKIALLNCSHSFHKECLSQSLRLNIDERKFPIKCPDGQCGKEVIVADIKEFLPIDYVNKFNTYSFEKYVEMNSQDMSWCPTPGCSFIFCYNEKDDSMFNCPLCRNTYCLKCHTVFHKGMTCKQYMVSRRYDKNDEKFINFIKGSKYKQCPKCKMWVEKATGCDHMTCRCRFQFCYVCGGVYQNCACTGGKAGRPQIIIPEVASYETKKGRSQKPQPPVALRPAPPKPVIASPYVAPTNPTPTLSPKPVVANPYPTTNVSSPQNFNATSTIPSSIPGQKAPTMASELPNPSKIPSRIPSTLAGTMNGTIGHSGTIGPSGPIGNSGTIPPQPFYPGPFISHDTLTSNPFQKKKNPF